MITIDHAQREESMHEAIFVSKAALECDFEIRVFKLPPASIIGNKQNTLRQARYKILTDYCHQFRNVCLFTAHHMDDQIETFLMRLGRGSGSKGLSSIPQYGHMFGIPIFRPLLLLRKSELKELFYLNVRLAGSKIKAIKICIIEETKCVRRSAGLNRVSTKFLMV